MKTVGTHINGQPMYGQLIRAIQLMPSSYNTI